MEALFHFFANHTHSLTNVMLDLSTLSPLFVDRIGRSLRFCYLEFDKEAIFDVCRCENAQYRWGVLNIERFWRTELL